MKEFIIDKGNNKDLIRVSLSEFNDKKYLDIRICYLRGDELGFTKKGINLPAELIGELQNAINALALELNKA